jgi:protein-S-isoprenylcysteine O-methyltransferase Ste14
MKWSAIWKWTRRWSIVGAFLYMGVYSFLLAYRRWDSDWVFSGVILLLNAGYWWRERRREAPP